MRSSMTRFGVAVAAMLLLAACGEEAAQSSNETGNDTAQQAGSAAGGEISAFPLQTPAADDPYLAKGYAVGDIILGDANAPVTIIEYASLTCPHCASFHVDTYPTLKKDYIDTGKARLIVREVYFDQFGLFAAVIARCGGEQRYYPYLDVFFERQAQWTGAGDEESIMREIRSIGRFGGMAEERIDACLNDQPFVNQLLQNYQAAAEADGVRSTPYFLVNGEPIRGNVGMDEMRRVIDDALGG